MSDWSRQRRAHFLSLLALSLDALERVPPSLVGGMIRLRTRHPGVPYPPRLCPLTAACWHATGTRHALNNYRQAGEDLALPRGMALLIQGAADREPLSPRRQPARNWWHTRLVDTLDQQETNRE